MSRGTRGDLLLLLTRDGVGLHADDLAALGLHLGAVAGGLLVPAGGGGRGARGTFRGQLRTSRIPGAATALHSAAKAGSGNTP